MKVRELITAMDAIAPLRYAESWDNVGLLAGDPDDALRRVIVTIDLTKAVADEAARLNVDAVVAYHPPIFKGLKRIPPKSPLSWALRNGVAIYSPHTALDAAPGGTNDWLADAVGMLQRAPLVVHAGKDTAYKLVTFVPPKALDEVANAVFSAGAGRIGQYTSCSFRSPGTGTFFGEEGTNPTIGSAGRLETADEIRVETLVPATCVAGVVAALRAAHPYDEPAFDLVRLAAPPEGVGMGRIGTVDAIERSVLVERIKQALRIDHALVAGPRTGHVTRVAVAAGAGGELLNAAIDGGAQVVLTGEVRHHDALAAAARGVTIVSVLHSRSERGALPSLADRLRERLPGVEVLVSEADADPFVVV